MRIAVIGAGYVGLVQGIGIARFGHQVTIYETDFQKINSLEAGIIPFFEMGLQETFAAHKDKIKFEFVNTIQTPTHYNDIKNHDIVFIAVGTPPSQYDGSADLRVLISCIQSLHDIGVKCVVIKSTVPPGTAEEIIYKSNSQLQIISNPEFLREGSALQDFMRPDRIVLGGDKGSPEFKKVMDFYKDMYSKLDYFTPDFIETDNTTAELSKYASNAFLAMKVTYINEMANLCRMIGANANEVAKIMGTDPRIGAKFLKPGPGFGGSCFPKDVQALIRVAERSGVRLSLVEQLQNSNDRRLIQMADDISLMMEQSQAVNPKVAVFGLGFKANTDDTRGSPASIICPILDERGIHVVEYDSLIKISAIRMGIVRDPKKFCPEGIDGVVILTECQEFRDIILNAQLKPGTVIMDLRNLFDNQEFANMNVSYFNLG